MIDVALAYIFDTEVIKYEGKQDRSPFVAPQTRGEGALVVVVLEKFCLQEVVGEAAWTEGDHRRHYVFRNTPSHRGHIFGGYTHQ